MLLLGASTSWSMKPHHRFESPSDSDSEDSKRVPNTGFDWLPLDASPMCFGPYRSPEHNPALGSPDLFRGPDLLRGVERILFDSGPDWKKLSYPLSTRLTEEYQGRIANIYQFMKQPDTQAKVIAYWDDSLMHNPLFSEQLVRQKGDFEKARATALQNALLSRDSVLVEIVTREEGTAIVEQFERSSFLNASSSDGQFCIAVLSRFVLKRAGGLDEVFDIAGAPEQDKARTAATRAEVFRDAIERLDKDLTMNLLSAFVDHRGTLHQDLISTFDTVFKENRSGLSKEQYRRAEGRYAQTKQEFGSALLAFRSGAPIKKLRAALMALKEAAAPVQEAPEGGDWGKSHRHPH
jgi:hypothetical protein